MSDLTPERPAARVERHRAVTSTNSLALERARDGTAAGLAWIVAAEQTGGRGRHGRHWHSPPGNLHATRLVVAPPPLPRLAGLAFVAALALHDAVAGVVDARARARLTLKWPNDLLAGGAKLAGVLTEAETVGPSIAIAIGIGVNVAGAPFAGATSLEGLGATASASDLFARLDAAFEARFAQWQGGRGFASVRADWLARAAAPGSPATVRTGRETLSGRFAGLAEDGALLLELDSGQTRRIAAGEVLDAGEAA